MLKKLVKSLLFVKLILFFLVTLKYELKLCLKNIRIWIKIELRLKIKQSGQKVFLSRFLFLED